MPAVYQLERQWQQRLQSGDARLGGGEGEALALLILRRMVGDDDVDGAVRQSGDDGGAVVLDRKSVV